MDKLNGFVAYPSTLYQVGQAISHAIEIVNRSGKGKLVSWEENDIAGRPLTAPIFESIGAANILIADVTHLNFNVTFEIGYAIASGVRVFLIRNREFEIEDEKARKVGIFDTLGYEEYANGDELSKKIRKINDLSPLPIGSTVNEKQPVYILESPVRGHVATIIASRVKKTRLPYRSFNPAEESRLSANSAIEHVASSLGVVIPLLSGGMKDAEIHNIRAAFVAGLSFGMHKETLILQDSNGPIPLDARDLTKIYSHPEDIKNYVHDFSQNVYDRLFDTSEQALPAGNMLSRLAIGDPMAENELQSLGNYYVQTDEYGRALRGEVNLVVGRKGTGKTALFAQVRDRKRSNRKNIVLDLKPEGYQLMKLKDDVLEYLSAGARSHLIVAFWEYLLYLEICRKILEKDRDRHLRENSLYEDYNRLKSIYQNSGSNTEGDFSERLQVLSEEVAYRYATAHDEDAGQKLTGAEVTRLIHSENIVQLRRELGRYLRKKEEIWLLFDNLDKGWSPVGLKSADITIVRCLLDAARKIQRDLQKEHIPFHGIIFIRNDVYQLLMDESPDFGKESRASLDWSDPDLLRELLRKRLVANGLPDSAKFLTLWRRICAPLYNGEETSQYLIDRSLMRPRNLLKLFQACKGFAVNLRHEKIQFSDIEKGIRAYSNDLLVDADQELTDMDPSAKNLIYQFDGEDSDFTIDELHILLDSELGSAEKAGEIIDFLLYYGFLGIMQGVGEPQYIYDCGYDMRLLRTRIEKGGSSVNYVLNPAFWPALKVASKH